MGTRPNGSSDLLSRWVPGIVPVGAVIAMELVSIHTAVAVLIGNAAPDRC